MNSHEKESRKNKIAERLTELAEEEAHELIDRPIGKACSGREEIGLRVIAEFGNRQAISS